MTFTLQLTPGKCVEITLEEYVMTLAAARRFMRGGMAMDDAMELAVHQLRLSVWMRLSGRGSTPLPDPRPEC